MKGTIVGFILGAGVSCCMTRYFVPFLVRRGTRMIVSSAVEELSQPKLEDRANEAIENLSGALQEIRRHPKVQELFLDFKTLMNSRNRRDGDA